ncbi:ribosomal protein S18-alanine N-acetyltransferase [Acutalibacter sp. 1XD8-33]|uniref:ribosomal protein S18-alanine N-acetyltransferase n=1 Tax=Acutalibacter sp. 1XD8-33 TaxID=2320081 RepID=UPI001FAA4CB4|nr:ribosomal protein S18-alanine N-acetyltransferase [Acutalibacter sp. 1XD8-33]
MSAGHLEAVAEIERVCFSSPWSRQALAEELSNPNAVYLVAVDEGLAVGYGGMRFAAGEFYVDNIAVLPECRRRGIGRQITSALLQEARRRGGSFLSLEVRPSNQAAIELYLRLGFLLEGRRKNFYTKPAEDALIFTRRFL